MRGSYTEMWRENQTRTGGRLYDDGSVEKKNSSM
jgi:hypothetical protein